MNSLKVGLSCSELIRSIFLSSCTKFNLGTFDGLSDSLKLEVEKERFQQKQSSINEKWDEIEQQMRDESFQSFLTSRNIKSRNAIDLLFDLVSGKYASNKPFNSNLNKEDELYTYLYIKNMVDVDGDAWTTWLSILNVYEKLLFWYHDRDLYHRIGFLNTIAATGHEDDAVYTLLAERKGKIALALSIPIAANVGGMATPIGTPPNAIALKYLNDPAGLNLNIGFGEWMSFMLPFTIVILFISWIVLLKLFPFKQKTIELKIEGEMKKDWRSIVVYVTFAVTILLWILDKYTGVNSNVVAMLPVAVFPIMGIITKRDLEEISWSVLWMVAGGFALGAALQETGLASHLIASIPFNTWPPVLMVIGSGLICYAMANFISHTATATLLVPILAIAGTSMQDVLMPVGGVSTLLIGVAIGSSLAMILPISTPPNALAHATGMIEQKDMVKTGVIMGVVGLSLGYLMLILLGSNGLI